MRKAFYKSAVGLIVLTVSGHLVCNSPCFAEGRAAESQAPSKSEKPGSSAGAAMADAEPNPEQAKAYLAQAEAFREAGKDDKAADYYLKATRHDPTLYLAFHQLSVIKASPEQVDAAISRLTKLKEKNPRELMLHVALSELLEKKGEYKNAAYALVGLVYRDAVPPEFHTKVEARIHYLLVRAKDKRAKATTAKNLADEELDIVPPPMPVAPSKKELSPTASKESGSIKGVGNARLVP